MGREGRRGLIDGQLGKDLHKDIARITPDNVDPGGQSMVNLERICKDIARITSDNVDPGGSVDGQLGKDLQRHCKDYL